MATSSGQSSGPAAARLKPLLPSRIGNWRQQSLNTPQPVLGPDVAPSVSAVYRRGDQVANLDVSDLSRSPPAPWGSERLERRTEDGNEVLYREGGRSVHETTAPAGQPNRVVLTLANGIVVGASGLAVPVADLKKLAEGADIAAAEALPPR